MKIDLRTRCARCRKLKPQPRGPVTRMRAAEFERYNPYCSFHCQEWVKLENAAAWVESTRPQTPSPSEEA